VVVGVLVAGLREQVDSMEGWAVRVGRVEAVAVAEVRVDTQQLLVLVVLVVRVARVQLKYFFTDESNP
jgi:hypothetical protein